MVCDIKEKENSVLVCLECGMETISGIPIQCGKVSSMTLAQRAYEKAQCLYPSKSEFFENQNQKNILEWKGKFNKMENWLTQQNTEESNFALKLIKELIDYD
jgi:hypothetical protein